MVKTGVKVLTGQSDLEAAWRALVPYRPGEAVVIKVNFNNTDSCDQLSNVMDAYPETVNAVIRGLKAIGVPSDRIWIADPSRNIPARFRNRIFDPAVLFFTSHDFPLCAANCYRADYVDEDSPACSFATYPAGHCIRPASVFVEAHHLINIPLLKGHWGAGISLGLKSHYGSVRFTGGSQWSERDSRHRYLYEALNPDPGRSLLADVNNNPHIRDKTRLIIGDGLFGHSFSNTSPPERWKIFGDKSPNLLFFGTDPVATDSVMCDYLNEERGKQGIPGAIHSCLHYAQTLGLGVHDHWDGFSTRRYAMLDYVEITLNPSGTTGPIPLPFSDGFENYSAGESPPPPWTNLAGRPGWVKTARAYAGTKSIAVSGGPVSPESSVVDLGRIYTDFLQYEGWVHNEGGEGFIGFHERHQDTTPSFNAVRIQANREVYFESADQATSFKVLLMSGLNSGWHHVKVQLDFQTLRGNVLLDNALVGNSLAISPKNIGTSLGPGFIRYVGVIHSSGPPFYVDDFTVLEWIPSPPSTPTISVNPSSLSASCLQNQNAPSQSFEIWNSGAGTVSYSISATAPWLSCAPSAGESTGERDPITVNYQTSNLPAGIHSATITINSSGAGNSPLSLGVSLEVTPPSPTISMNPSSLSTSCMQNQNPPSQSFEIWNSGAGTLSYSLSPNASWLSCTPSAGTSTGEHHPITVNYQTSNLPAGIYSAIITISSIDASNSPIFFSVDLEVRSNSGTTLAGGGSGGGSGGGCFIATAVFASPRARETRILSEFRDEVLAKFGWGRNLIRSYYRFSPPVAHFIEKYELLKIIVRWGLRPFIGASGLILRFILHPPK